MSFGDYITEIRASELELERVLYLIKRDCKPFLKRIKGAKEFLWRGIEMKSDDITKIIPRKNRYPKDTPQDIHDAFDSMFKQRFGWKARSEGVFCYATKGATTGYGAASYMIFPIGDWGFLWSSKINDLYSETKEAWENGGMEPDRDDYDMEYGEGSNNGKWYYEGTEVGSPMELAVELAEEDRSQCERDAEYDCGEEPSEEQEELFSGEFSNRNEWKNCVEEHVDECMQEKIDYEYDRIESYKEWEPGMSWEEYVAEWQSERGPEVLENELGNAVKGYSNKGFKKAIMANNEIMVNCDAYYAVPAKMALPLKKEFLQGKIVVGLFDKMDFKAKVRKM